MEDQRLQKKSHSELLEQEKRQQKLESKVLAVQWAKVAGMISIPFVVWILLASWGDANKGALAKFDKEHSAVKLGPVATATVLQVWETPAPEVMATSTFEGTSAVVATVDPYDLVIRPTWTVPVGGPRIDVPDGSVIGTRIVPPAKRP